MSSKRYVFGTQDTLYNQNYRGDFEMVSDNEITALKENLDQKRNIELKRILIVFALWSVWWVVLGNGIHLNSTDPFRFLKAGLLILGLLLLAVSVVLFRRIILLQKRIWSTPELRETVDDDIVRLAWLRAAAVGFCSMLGAEIIFTCSSLFLVNIGGFRSQVVWSGSQGPIVICIGIVTVVGAFLFFRRD